MKRIVFKALALVLTCSAATGQAQDIKRGNVLKLAPLGLIGKLQMEYERTVGPQFSLGISGSQYFGNITFPGQKGEVYSRLYFRHEVKERETDPERKPNAPKLQQTGWKQPVETLYLTRAPHGFYLQVKASYGEFDYSQNYDFTELRYDADGFLAIGGIRTGKIRKEQHLIIKGGSFSAGYQVLLGRKQHFALDVNVGIQQFPLPKGIGEDFETVTYENGYQIKTKFTSFDFDRVEWYLYGPGAYLSTRFNIGYAF